MSLHFKYQLLLDLGACEERLEFKRRFGNEVLATVTTAVANAPYFNWWWIADTTLTLHNRMTMTNRVREAYPGGDSACYCPLCDPEGGKRRFVAQTFAELFLAQGGRR